MGDSVSDSVSPSVTGVDPGQSVVFFDLPRRFASFTARCRRAEPGCQRIASLTVSPSGTADRLLQ